ncbi:hypothetical protein IGI04_030080 [Brassica rapa subsp. trilocularis]|uniref:Uncharacterized protein n=1 Tax=Brassica rapa subsp. trilocularis TaxID=1813537 RepID=A0ABQ7LPS5_BRACM|nr:hypothetical protein IGI04_030080 [Brassica rapa subsp. trilocularis]
MTKRPLINHKFAQIGDAQRPRHVAPTGRSGLQERLKRVALRGRSSSILCRQTIEKRATLECRSSKVALRGVSQRLHGVAPVSRSHALLVR